jgi:hypothetical protein
MSDIKEFIAKTYGVVWANKTQLENLEQFAALVRADEREACAKLCIELAPSNKTMTAYKVLHEASKAIQARGQA